MFSFLSYFFLFFLLFFTFILKHFFFPFLSVPLFLFGLLFISCLRFGLFVCFLLFLCIVAIGLYLLLLFVLFFFVYFYLFFSSFFLWLCFMACGLLIPWPGDGPGPLEWEHWVQDAGLQENSWAQGILSSIHSPRGIHLNTKTRLQPTASRLQWWTPHTKQPARQEQRPTHQQTGCLKWY